MERTREINANAAVDVVSNGAIYYYYGCDHFSARRQGVGGPFWHGVLDYTHRCTGCNEGGKVTCQCYMHMFVLPIFAAFLFLLCSNWSNAERQEMDDGYAAGDL